MRPAWKSTLALLALYLLALAGVVAWVRGSLWSLAGAAMEQTARLVGNELVSAVSQSTPGELLGEDRATRLRNLEVLRDVARHSQLARSLTVVGAAGEVLASDDFLDLGRRLPPPAEVFGGGGREPILQRSSASFLGGEIWTVLVPIRGGGRVAGYVRVVLDTSPIAALYGSARRQLWLGAAAGLALIGALAFLLHVQLVGQGRAVAAAFERALEGRPETALDPRDELSPAFRQADRVGRELQRARRQGIDAQRRLQALSQVMDVGVVLLGAGGELEFANRRARELLGCGEQPAEERWAALRQQLAPALEAGGGDGGVRRADVELPTPGGPRPLRLQGYELEGGEGRLVLLRDRAMLEALETDLALAAQLRSLTRLYRALAHDLRAPLNSMVLNLELLRDSLQRGDDEAARDDRQHWVRVLRDELDRLNRSLQGLLAETAPARREREEFDLRGLVEEVRNLIAPQARMQGVAVETALPSEPVPLTGHRDRLKQAMLNVVINALEAMGEGGHLRLGLEQVNSHATISVHDSGPGIPTEVSSRIFDLHFTTKSSGTGIGLYVARSVAEAHGGAIDVESEPGKGSTFRLRLPLIS